MKTFRATVTYEVRARDMATAQKKVAKITGRKDIKVVKMIVSGGLEDVSNEDMELIDE